MNVSDHHDVTPSTEFIRSMLPLVKRIAATFATRLPPTISIEDLVSAGFLALVEMHKRNHDLSPQDLERLASPRLRGAMLDEMRQADPLSRRIRRRARQVVEVIQAYESRHGRRPTEQEVAAQLGVTPEAAAHASALARGSATTVSDAERIAELPDHRADDPESNAQRGERFARFESAVGLLPQRQRQIVELYFGYDLTLRQIGEKFGVTEARISQLLSVAVKELRVRCASIPPPAP